MQYHRLEGPDFRLENKAAVPTWADTKEEILLTPQHSTKLDSGCIQRFRRMNEAFAISDRQRNLQSRIGRETNLFVFLNLFCSDLSPHFGFGSDFCEQAGPALAMVATRMDHRRIRIAGDR
jgi:hypothetical protein